MAHIPFNRPFIAGNELQYISEAVKQMHISGDGPFSRKCHALLERLLAVPKLLLTTSGTHALEMAALLLDVQPGDEVILPSFTFVSTANAFVLRGARPVFSDIRPDTLNLDERGLGPLITARTRAIVPVHYAGVGCAMDSILPLAARYGIAVVEDNAHGLFGTYQGKYLGTFGCMAALSFHETKNFSCGEGGALIINDPALIERAEIVREKGTDRSRFFRGQVDKYTWVDIGSSYLPSDLNAAYLYAQLEARDRIQSARARLWHCYVEQLQGWAEANGVRLPAVPPECGQSYHMFYLILPSRTDRDSLIDHFAENTIAAVFHYVPLHLSEMGRRFGGRPGQYPVTEDLSERLLRLPLYNDMTVEEQAQVIATLTAWNCGAAARGDHRALPQYRPAPPSVGWLAYRHHPPVAGTPNKPKL